MYLVLQCFLIPRHEPWADEAQAWQLARTLNLRALFGTYIHYEVSPGLWHLLLWVEARFHVGYVGMHWCTAALAFAGVLLLATKSPFPFWLRCLLPFTFYFAYQYSIVARNYSLIAPLLFAIASLWPRRNRHSIGIAALLGLLANTAAHGLMIGVGIAWMLAVEWRRAPAEGATSRKRRVFAAALFLGLSAFSVWTLIPARDADLITGTRAAVSAPAREKLKTALSPHPIMSGLPVPVQVIIGILYRIPGHLGVGMASDSRVGMLIWALLCWRWFLERRLCAALPVLFLGLFTGVTKFAPYHAGLFWLLLLFLLWVTWPTTQVRSRIYSCLHWSTVSLLLVCVACQLTWAASAARYDIRNAYSPDREAAVLLRNYKEQHRAIDIAVPSRETTIAHGEFFAVGLEPYFDHEPFANMNNRFWVWRDDSEMRTKYLHDATQQSTVVLVEETTDDPRMEDEGHWLRSIGYRQTASICGRMFAPRTEQPKLCHTFFEPGDPLVRTAQ